MDSLRSNTTDKPRKLDTFLIPSISPNSSEKLHLHVAITDPVDSGNRIPQILLVSISSIRPGKSGHDQTCILKPVDHPFITCDSYVVYRKAIIVELRNMERMLKNGIIKPKERADAKVVDRIIKGIEKSPATKNYIVDFLRQATGRI